METETETLLPKPTTYGSRRRQHLNRVIITTGGKEVKIIRLRRRPRMYWRIRFRALGWLRRVATLPLKLLAKFPKDYMNFMGGLATKTENKIFGGKQAPKVPQVSNKGYSIDAFEARLIYEISKTLVASHELNPL